MQFFIKNLKISNFLSFFGDYDVRLKPFSAIMCNFYEGKDDLLRAFEFVFGNKITEIRVDNPLDLVHEVLREETLINNDIRCFVEITLYFFQEKKELKLHRGVKNGINSTRLEHKIGDVITSGALYEDKLMSLGLHINKKNCIFRKMYFNEVIWGSSENLEMTICTCLRQMYLLEEWEKIKKEVDYLTKIKNRTAEKSFNSAKKSHSVIAKFVKKYETVSDNREMLKEKILQHILETSASDESSLTEMESSEKEESCIEEKEKKQNIFELETQIDFLEKRLNDLKLREAHLSSFLYYEEIKLAVKPVNASVLQNRISQVKNTIAAKENNMSETWEKILKVREELKDLNQRITTSLVSMREMQNATYLQNRFTSYGRFCDYLEPSRYVQLLRQIIGDEIFYANFCDSMDQAFSAITLIKTLKYENREIFICFENYSHKLKDILTASGEKGVQINTLEQLLIFLCKLKHFGLIEEVPVMAQKEIDYDESIPDEEVFFLQNGMHSTGEGLIKLHSDESTYCMETEDELRRNLVQLETEEEIKYQEWNDLLFTKWRTLYEMNSLENDVLYLKQKWKKSAPKLRPRQESNPLPEIYADFSETFKEFAEDWDKYQSELQAEEELFTKTTSKDLSTTSSEEPENLAKDLEDVKLEKSKIENQLQVLTNDLRLLYITPFHSFRLQKNFIKLNILDKTKLFFEKEFKRLKKLMNADDLEDFLGSQEWRKTFISFLTKDFGEIKNILKLRIETLQNVAAARKTKLYQFLEHCGRYLASTFRGLLSDALPFIDLSLTSGEEKLQIMSSMGETTINVVEMTHFNTFLNFITALSIFLEIAVFDNIPLMIFEDIEEYFPTQSDNLEAVLDFETLNKIIPHTGNPRFQLLMRIGQFLEHFIKKHTPGHSVRNNGSNKGYPNGPTQIIYFSKEDLIHSASHYIWIHNQILPDEYITESCNSYSEILEIDVEEFNHSDLNGF